MNIESSYSQNNYGDLFYKLVTFYRPKLCVEFGVLHGYSTYYIACGLRDNHKLFNEFNILHSYDLFEEYLYNHGDFKTVQKMLDEQELSRYVILNRGDAFKKYKDYEDEQIDFLHIDISNTGEILREIVKLWTSKIKSGGKLLFEGGSEERDSGWIKKYNKSPIKKELETNEEINKYFTCRTYQLFPSLTVLNKKWGESKCQNRIGQI